MVRMAAGNPSSQEFFEEHGVVCRTVEVNELIKAAGGIGCPIGILQRDIKAPIVAVTDSTAGHPETV